MRVHTLPKSEDASDEAWVMAVHRVKVASVISNLCVDDSDIGSLSRDALMAVCEFVSERRL